MASIFRQSYTVKDKNGKRIRKKSKFWYIDFKTADGSRKRIKGFKDKQATTQRAAQLVKEVELAKAGVVDRYKEHRKRPLIEHLADFKESLLATTTAGPKRFGMTGCERALLYRLAAESGLRANELRSLKVSSFDFRNLTLTVRVSDTKNRKLAVLPLKRETAAELREFFQGKMPTTKAFGGTYKRLTLKTADMLKADSVFRMWITGGGTPTFTHCGTQREAYSPPQGCTRKWLSPS